MVAPALIGAGLGALAGGLTHKKKTVPSFVTPKFVTRLGVGGVGAATANGFTPDRSTGFNNAVGTAENNLNPLLNGILNHGSTGNTERFQNAFINARRPQLDTALQQRKQNLNSNIAAQGLGGSSAALFAQGQNARNNNEQIQQLLNQGIVGGQALQQQDLQNQINKFGLANNLSQQNFGNTLQSALGLGGLLNQNNQSAINQANALNGIASARAQAADMNKGGLMSSILSGAIGGASLGKGISGMGEEEGSGGGGISSWLGGLFGGGGGGNVAPSNMYNWLPQR